MVTGSKTGEQDGRPASANTTSPESFHPEEDEALNDSEPIMGEENPSLGDSALNDSDSPELLNDLAPATAPLPPEFVA